MKNLYVIGGQQRSSRPLFADDQHWYEYQKGVLLQVTPETGAAKACVSYVSPLDTRTESDPVLFKCGTLAGDRLYACTQTEVMIFALPSFEQVGYISLPSFNDVHHVRPTAEGNLLVVSSGLELVMEMTPEGQVLREWNVLGEAPWARFSRDIDYRKGISTKPHRGHPNYVFQVGDEVWATRFQQKDAICLTNRERRIDIGGEHVHDGVLHEGLLYFTQVDGKVVIANPQTLKIEEIIDLNLLSDEGTQLGWCRGLMFDNGRTWIGFTRIRPTKFREAVSWVRLGFHRVLPSHIACYDLGKKQLVSEFDVEAHGLNAVFSIFPAEAVVLESARGIGVQGSPVMEPVS